MGGHSRRKGAAGERELAGWLSARGFQDWRGRDTRRWNRFTRAFESTLEALSRALAMGLVLRHDNGPQCVSSHFQNELEFLGIESSPSFVRAPQGNGNAERFIRTLKEPLLWVRRFETVEELRRELLAFK